ncbi:MAG: HEAT repeat domain-containing protein [Conexivisphaerales archaeon]
MYTSRVLCDEEYGFEVMLQMEKHFRDGDEDFFVNILKNEDSLVLRLHAVTILAEIGKDKAVKVLGDVLLNDPDPLVRHEAAFSMGQIGLSSANEYLCKAALYDKDPVVRHESAAALGSIGSKEVEDVLLKVAQDPEPIVSNSAKASLFTIRFLKKYFVGATARERAPRP